MSGCDDFRVRGEILLAVTGAYAGVLEAQANVLWAEERYATTLRHGAWGQDPVRAEADADADLLAAHAQHRQALRRYEALVRAHGAWINRRDDGRPSGVWEVDW